MSAGERHVIVGAGQAGGWAAIAMRQAGFTGEILLIGDEPLRPYERPPLSKGWLTGVEEPEIPFLHDPSRYDGIELLTGTRVEAILSKEQRLVLADNSLVPYDRLLLATGGRARPLSVPGGGHAHLLRTVEDARALRRRFAEKPRLVCIGAGVIGLEIASAAVARGCVVTVVEAAPRPMGRCVTPEVAERIAELHREAGVRLVFGAAVESVSPQGRGFRVSYGGEAMDTELVVAGIGMDRGLSLAHEAGILTDGGIRVDAFGRTSVANVYAAGDVAAFYHPLFGRILRLESWRHAQNHGIAVGRAMSSVEEPYVDIPWFWSDQHGQNLQVAGLPDQATQTIFRDTSGGYTAVHLDGNDVVVAVAALNNARDIRAGTNLIKSSRPVDRALLERVDLSLQQIAKAIC